MLMYRRLDILSWCDCIRVTFVTDDFTSNFESFCLVDVNLPKIVSLWI